MKCDRPLSTPKRSLVTGDATVPRRMLDLADKVID
jgi:hypothetical protein